jgi:hypothetical protein
VVGQRLVDRRKLLIEHGDHLAAADIDKNDGDLLR